MLPGLQKLRLANLQKIEAGGVDREAERDRNDDIKRNDELRVDTIQIWPRPKDAADPFEEWKNGLHRLEEMVFRDDSNVLVEEMIREKLMRMPDEPHDFNSALTLLADYMAIAIMGMKATGPPTLNWRGYVTNARKYPYSLAQSIWEGMLVNGKHYMMRNVLKRICEGTPKHPWYTVEQLSWGPWRPGAFSYLDTMGGILQMMMPQDTESENHMNYTRKLLLATRRNEYVGHIFVTYGSKPVEGVKGVFPYGIQRSPFYLPGTCVDPKDASGFVEALFQKIGEIAEEEGLTHVFTFPLEKMKQRFLKKMGYTLVAKGTYDTDEFKMLQLAVESIFGPARSSGYTTWLLRAAFRDFDFVLNGPKKQGLTDVLMGAIQKLRGVGC